MSLKNYFPESDHPEKATFDKLLGEIYTRTDFFSYIAHVKSGHYHHTSPSIELILGYSVEQFEREGVDFYMKRVPPEDILNVISIQADFFKTALEPGFNQLLPHIVEMSSRFIKTDGEFGSFVGLTAPLAYLPNGGHDFALVICYAYPGNDLEDKKLNVEIRALLRQVKFLYNNIYTLPKSSSDQPTLPVEIIFAKDPKHILTAKEKEVLKEIAKGNSTKQIANIMGVSENTVETHRKNMLTKLDAKNVAELIKKASKLYWLE